MREQAAGKDDVARSSSTISFFALFRHKVDDPGMEAQARQSAGDHDGRPDQRDDAIVNAAHVARQHNLAAGGRRCVLKGEF